MIYLIRSTKDVYNDKLKKKRLLGPIPYFISAGFWAMKFVDSELDSKSELILSEILALCIHLEKEVLPP